MLSIWSLGLSCEVKLGNIIVLLVELLILLKGTWKTPAKLHDSLELQFYFVM